jgi:membrane associated rhomboid family serine protease
MEFKNISFKIPIIHLAICWGLHGWMKHSGVDIRSLCIIPRKIEGLFGILFGNILHGSNDHLISNSSYLIILGFILFAMYREIAPKVFLICYIVPSILVFLFARGYEENTNGHLGSSILIFGYLGFLGSIGFFKKDFKSILISAVILVFYGKSISAMFYTPMSNISYESHLFGALVGILIAAFYAKNNHLNFKQKILEKTT